MTKKILNQNAKFVQTLIDTIEPNFNFSNEPINRLKTIKNNESNNNNNKIKKLSDLKEKINSIENCNLKDNSKNLILGDGDVNGAIMLIGLSLIHI